VAAVAAGPIARDAEGLFASDWAFCGGDPTELAAVNPEPVAEGEAALQWVASGPDSVGDPLYDGLVGAIFSATRRAVIVTPYYVPDELLHRAVIIAARRGVRTQLVIPAKSNHALADYARRSLVRELRAAGVEIWAYRPGMVHAKTVVVDDGFAYVGSPNFDMRSLNLNYECALFLYQPPEVHQVEAWVDALIAKCLPDRVDLRSIGLVEEIARLASPEI
jgi:cardiolipin synthase